MRFSIAIIVISLMFTACNEEIGDSCSNDPECSPNMERNCDQGQPGGYCLIIGCSSDECPSEAVCVEFITPCPEGEDYYDPDAGATDKCNLIEPNRGRTYCLRHCDYDSDCRGAYQCMFPEDLEAAVIDFYNSDAKICVPRDQ
jgi:hypothetical protein